MLDAVACVRDREKEVTLEMALGTRPPRVGMWWGWVPGRTRTAHFFIEVKWKAIGARADTEPFDVRLESACMRWDLDRYAKDDRPARRIEDLTTWKQVCRRCAFEVQQEDA
jgi:hypothetical protein